MERYALDLFCGAGGVSVGLARAGFTVIGVDVTPQPHYPFRFVQVDAMSVTSFAGFDFVWASPPCQGYSQASVNTGTGGRHPRLIEAVRDKLLTSGCPLWAIENVPGAPLRDPLMLCGSMFSLPIRRHRLFELHGIPLPLTPECDHSQPAIRVFGHGTDGWFKRRYGRTITQAERETAMGIDWMNRDELAQAIPPAMSEFVGRAAMAALAAKAA